MKKIFLIITSFFVTIIVANAQLENNIWYFGSNAGITFSTNPPTALTDGALNTMEGCATICDNSGNLLFYTDGITVYNKIHQIMDNGTGLNGHPSSSQSAIIVPKPASNNIYYIFTVDWAQWPSIGNNKGLQYSEVDMDMNGGLGKVIIKNTELIKPTSEKVTVAKHSNNDAYWVITHGAENNNFYSFLISSSGINTTPIISSVGSFQNYDLTMLGYLKASSNSQKLASAKKDGGELELFDFNNINGTVSNALQIGNNEDFYGVEFSPSNNKLYVSLEFSVPNNQYASIYQYDLLSTNIANSRNVIYSNSACCGGALQIGIDGKIYVCRVLSPYLGVINNPDDINCNFVLNAINLSGRVCRIGLPNIISPIFITNCIPTASFTASDTTICQGEQIDFINTTPAPTTSQKWLINNVQFDTSFNTNYTFNNVGTYTISLIALNDTCSDTTTAIINVNPLPTVNLGSNEEICEGDTIELTINPGYTNYLWQDGSTSNSFVISQAGTYWVTVNYNDCVNSDTVRYIACIENIDIWIPNSFTPNGDGLNDIFKIETTAEFSKFLMSIYNHWGQLIFESTDATIGWNGKFNGELVPLGVYTYSIEYTIKGNKKEKRHVGKVTAL